PREKVGDVVFAGSAAARDRLRALKPVSRPDLAKAFAAAVDGAVQVALIPPPYLGRIIEEVMPTLPREVGGGSGKGIARGVKWAALGLDAPPKMALRLTVQSADADAARALTEALGRALKALAGQNDVRNLLPGFDKAAAMLNPKAEQ